MDLIKTFNFEYYYKKASGNSKVFHHVVKGDPLIYKQVQEYLKQEGLSFNEFFYLGYYKKKKPFCHCGKEVRFKNFTSGYYKNCSSKCAGSNKLTLKKRVETNIKKYGKDNAMKHTGIREKQQQKNRIKAIKDYKEKFKETVLISQEEEQLFINNKKENTDTWEFICKKCNTSFQDKLYKSGNNKGTFDYTIPRCLKCFPFKEKHIQKELYEYVKKLDKNALYEEKIFLSNLELDILTKKIAIEFNGLMFHSFGKSKYSIFDNYEKESEGKKKHLNKTLLCKEKRIQLLHIFENEWLDPMKQDIWKSIISGKTQQNSRIYARNTILDIDISSKESKQFLEENHLQGSVPSSVRIGLRNKSGELLCLMTFGKSRYGSYEYEMLRFSSKKYINVIGGASKIFKYFKENILKEKESIVTYADRRYSNGDLYKKLNFNYIHSTQPNYFYFKRKDIFQLYSRVTFQKHKLKDILDIFDENLTETQNMYNNGYRKIYDCGNLVYIYRK